ncbi:hypothetical protein J437_LFUL016113 [Ladona fulva]|uniref:SMB domain-containing protein n=1 Tax=Ladona fulva TaxID=123851 RepID=A0A8K0KL36_LADFU|nr:hypothetical protein J437_LFUL016113 [Ladona fulva]
MEGAWKILQEPTAKAVPGRQQARDECCNGRIDDCSVPILGTLCYCDQFCDRGYAVDCCPDYWRVCSVLDQGWCATSWALSATTVISDRAAISDALEKRLRYEHFLDCHFTCVLSSEKCSKGHLHLIWRYLSDYGAPEDKCVKKAGPSEAQCRSSGECRRFKSGPAYKLGDVNRMQHNIMVYGPLQAPEDKCVKKAGPSEAQCRSSGECRRFKSGPAYKLGDVNRMQHNIMVYGPLQATMRVYHDFFHYKKGVYSRPGGCNTTEPHGYHSVRIIGWGVDHSKPDRSPIPYWVVANSWGTWWGEGGYFRIKKGVNECEIESYVLTAWVHPELASPHYR